MKQKLVTEVEYSGIANFMVKKLLKMLNLHFIKLANWFANEAFSSPLTLRSI